MELTPAMHAAIFVIIDQLGWHDHALLPSLSAFLGEPNCVDLPYFPTLTETAHASVSVTALPSQHGIIGGNSYVERPEGLAVVGVNDDLFTPSGYGLGVPFAFSVVKQNCECFVVAGKRKVAQLVSPLPNDTCPRGLIRATLQPSEDNRRLVWEVISHRQHLDLPNSTVDSYHDPTGMDLLLLQAARALFDQAREPGVPCFLFLGLSHSTWTDIGMSVIQTRSKMHCRNLTMN